MIIWFKKGVFLGQTLVLAPLRPNLTPGAQSNTDFAKSERLHFSMADFCLRIDDTDPRIEYWGPWQTVTHTTTPKDFSSSIYNGTLHGTNSNSTSLYFNYQG